ncbi:hypothetical protein NC653_041540 [Populus alba x Populus x berolinensis]|uniref:Uncharacterized protein n=1 Tax=Populus alba x Populus x berolinensis TaxID=444605 RepID=A0AAD6L8V0_9ROSI|nr:hypothetical protein NC653_041540 [Populus alba x Populus x berolinensis]
MSSGTLKGVLRLTRIPIMFASPGRIAPCR